MSLMLKASLLQSKELKLGLKRLVQAYSRRSQRIKTEEKAKDVASAWGEEFIKCLAALAVLPRTILKNRMNSSFFFKSSWCNSSFLSKHPGAIHPIIQIVQSKTASAARTFTFSSVFFLPLRVQVSDRIEVYPKV